MQSCNHWARFIRDRISDTMAAPYQVDPRYGCKPRSGEEFNEWWRHECLCSFAIARCGVAPLLCNHRCAIGFIRIKRRVEDHKLTTGSYHAGGFEHRRAQVQCVVDRGVENRDIELTRCQRQHIE